MASVRPLVKATSIDTPAFFAAISTPTLPAKTIMSAIERFVSSPSSTLRTLASSAGLFTFQFFAGSKRTRAPFAPPRISEPRKDAAEAHAVDTICDTDKPEPEMAAFAAAISV